MGVGDGVGEGVSDRAGRVDVSSDAEIGAGLSGGDGVRTNGTPEAGVGVSSVAPASICVSAELVVPHALNTIAPKTASGNTTERRDGTDRFRAIDPPPTLADATHLS